MILVFLWILLMVVCIMWVGVHLVKYRGDGHINVMLGIIYAIMISLVLSLCYYSQRDLIINKIGNGEIKIEKTEPADLPKYRWRIVE